MASAMLWLSFVAAMVPEVFGEIKDPTNIRIWSFNLKYVLKWDHVQSTNYRMTYTVNYRSHVGAWKAVKGCENITRTECDFSSADIIFHGEYFLRLRAHQGNWTSAWLCTESFIPSKDNEIGPPSIDIESQRNGLVVYISDLQMESNTSIKKIYKDVMYRITYWKENPSENANEKNSTNRLVVLTLEPWTTYCLKVLAFSSVYNKMGQNSSVVCKRTGGFAPLQLIVIGFHVSLVVFFIVAVGCYFCVCFMYRCIKYALFPPHTLPEHIQECFTEQAQKAPFHVLASVEDSEECCDPLVVIIETKNLSSSLDSFISNTENEKHEQSGQTSADSGQFSNAECSKNADFGGKGHLQDLNDKT